jgi:pimeloyl-ACP methyl ester carboxylesterase
MRVIRCSTHARTKTMDTIVSSTESRPFTYHAPQAELDDLRRRIVAARLPEQETVPDRSQGVQSATVRELACHWATGYDWRKVEAKMNAYPQFITEIDGLDIHFIHVRSRHENALPLIVTHGWPASIVALLKIIDPLTNPTAHGGRASDAFHVVIPSIPGYGFSGKPTTTGWGPARIAHAWAALMKRLGYTRYVAQGGDWGAIITDLMAAQGHPQLIGMHTNLPGVVPHDVDVAAFTGSEPPSGLSEEERRAFEQLSSTYKNVQYAFFMGSRPQALSALADSPMGLATFMLDPPLISRVFEGHAGSLTRDDVLDNVTLFWLTNTAVSAARLYWENKVAFFSPKKVAIPVAVSIFPEELYQAPRSWVERAYPGLVHYNKLNKGGHFPAWEEPELFVSELRAGFNSLR